MKKLYSLIKACMTSDMAIFKIKTKSKKTQTLLPIAVALYLMFMIWGGANTMFEKVAPMKLNHIMISLFVFSISFMTFMEGIYKSSSLIFNCKDDQLLLSLPIKRITVLFVRVFKFYVFELLFNSLFLLPIMIAYIRWENVTWTYYLTCIIMLLLLPIIPIILSCIVGVFTSSLSSRFKYKNLVQILVSMVFLLVIMYISFNMDHLFKYLIKHATSINDLITKIYYPAGVFAKLIIDFKLLDLIIFIIVNIVLFSITILILSKFYFKINSRLKEIITNDKKIKYNKLSFTRKNPTISLIKKEITIFFKTPVFIINAGFALVLYIVIAIALTIKFDSLIPILTSKESGLGLSLDLINNNLSIIIFMLIVFTSFMTSITNSVISLEGRNINILKSLPIKVKTILMSKVYSSLLITTPVLLIGNIIIFIKFRITIIEAILLILLSIIIPLISHFIGIIINLKYPRLDWENETEVVKQSASSLISVLLGMILLIISIYVITKVIGKYNSITILLISTLIYILVNIVLYLYLIKRSVNEFNKLSI